MVLVEDARGGKHKVETTAGTTLNQVRLGLCERCVRTVRVPSAHDPGAMPRPGHAPVAQHSAALPSHPSTAPHPTGQVLQKVCGNLNANPSDYALQYKKKRLDLSLPLRLSGIPSGSKIELVKSKASAGCAPKVVLIALQLPDGQRVQRKFASSMVRTTSCHHALE